MGTKILQKGKSALHSWYSSSSSGHVVGAVRVLIKRKKEKERNEGREGGRKTGRHRHVLVPKYLKGARVGKD